MTKAYILAGGKSSRMGTTKGMLPFNNKTFVEQIASILKPFFKEIVLISDLEEYKNISIRKIKDEIPGCGPLSGIHAALKDSANEEYIFITACDMPLINEKLVRLLVQPKNKEVLSCFSKNNNAEPLFAYYSTKLIDSIENALRKQLFSVKKFITQYNIKITPLETVIKGESSELQNINYPHEYQNLIQSTL